MKLAMQLESARVAGFSRGRLGLLPKHVRGAATQRAYRAAYVNGLAARAALRRAGLLKGAT